MQTIVSGKRSSVFFNPKNNTYLKTFSPKFSSKIKFFLKFRKYPGENFFYISTRLNKLNIKTVEILNFTKYSVTTNRLEGDILFDYLNKFPENKEIIYRYIELVSKVLNNNLYCGDFNLFNFIVKENELYALDLEDYKPYIFSNKKEAIRRLYSKVDSWIIDEIIKKL